MAASEPAPGAPRGPPGARGPEPPGGGAATHARPRGHAPPAPGLRRGRAWARERARAARRREGAFRGRRESLVLSLGMGGSTGPSPVAVSRPPAPSSATAPARADGWEGGRGAGNGHVEPHSVDGVSAPLRSHSLRLAAARFEEGGAGPRLAAARAAWDAAGLDFPPPSDSGPPPDAPSESPPGAQRKPSSGSGAGTEAGTGGTFLFPFIGTGGACASPPCGWGGSIHEARGDLIWPFPPAPGPAGGGASPAVSLSF